MKKETGITLIALIVTIIVLLILAGITIGTLMGENGIVNKANIAKERTKIEEYREDLQLIGMGLQPKRVMENLSSKEFMDRYEDEIKKDKRYEKVEREDDETIIVTTKEGYVYKITTDEVEYLGKDGEIKPPDLQESDIEFKVTPEGWTNKVVTVEIKKRNEKIEKYTLQYSEDGTNWQNYTKALTRADNGAIYARLWDGTNAGGYTTGNVENIDRLKPNSFTPTATSTTNSITLTGTTTDQEKTLIDGSSGIAKYYFSIDNGTTWLPEDGLAKTEEEQDVTYTFTELLEGTEYNLKMKAVDKAGNETETGVITYETEITKPTGIWASLEGNTLKFYTTEEKAISGGGKTYENVQGKEFVRNNNTETINTPWFSDKDQIKAVEFIDEVAPEYLAYYFSDLTSLETVNMEKVKTINVTNMYGLFLNCRNLKEINTKGFDTRNVTNMGWIFLNCSSLRNLDVTMFDTRKVTNMEVMFNGCSNLTELDVSSFDTRNVTTMRSMFANCSNLTELDVSNFDTSKVENMATMFYYSNRLTTLDLSNFNTSRVTDMNNMFHGCSGLIKLDVSKFNTSKVTNMNTMFTGCSQLTELDVLNFDTSNVRSGMKSMFGGCSQLTELDLSSFDTRGVTDMTSMFGECSKLKLIYVGSKWKVATSHIDMFKNCGTKTTTLKR